MSDTLPRGLKASLLVTDFGFLAYWSLTALAAAGLITIPAAYLYTDYHDPMVVAWNWSFMPLDVVLSLVGLAAVAQHRAGKASWRGLSVVSLSLTFCAGLMALTFWAIRGDFDPIWWAVNALLMTWPLIYLPKLVGLAGTPPRSP